LRLECEYSILEYLRVFFKGVLDGEDINLGWQAVAQDLQFLLRDWDDGCFYPHHTALFSR